LPRSRSRVRQPEVEAEAGAVGLAQAAEGQLSPHCFEVPAASRHPHALLVGAEVAGVAQLAGAADPAVEVDDAEALGLGRAAEQAARALVAGLAAGARIAQLATGAETRGRVAHER
jgi:hypothetical protein